MTYAHIFTAIFCLLNLVFTSFSFALSGPECEGGLSGQPERNRIELRNRIEEVQDRIAMAQKNSYDAYRRSIVPNHLAASISEPNRETINLIHEYALMDHTDRNALDAKAAVLKVKLAEDPYFGWLGKGSGKDRTDDARGTLLYYLDRKADGADIAIIRVQKDFDSLLNRHQRQNAEIIIRLHNIWVRNQREYVPLVTGSSHTIPWHLVDNPKTAMKALVDFVSAVEKRYSYLFPRKSFERFAVLSDDADAMNFIRKDIGDFWYETMSGMAKLPRNSPPTYNLAKAKSILKRLGLPEETTDPRILVRVIHEFTSEITYADFLLRVFRDEIPSNRGDEFDYEVYSGLKRILAMMDYLNDTEVHLRKLPK